MPIGAMRIVAGSKGDPYQRNSRLLPFSSHNSHKTSKVVSAVMAMQPPHLPPGMFHMLEMSDAGVLRPNFTAPPGADIEDMVKDGIDDAAMTNRHDALTAVAFGHLFDKKTDAGAEVHIGFAEFIGQGGGGKGTRGGPIRSIFVGQFRFAPRGVIQAVIAYFA